MLCRLWYNQTVKCFVWGIYLSPKRHDRNVSSTAASRTHAAVEYYCNNNESKDMSSNWYNEWIHLRSYGPERISMAWASCQIRKIAGAHAPGMPGTFSPSPQVSDPDMHHGTCVTHVPWCMPGSPTIGFLWNRRRGKTFPAFPAHAQPAILRIW